MPLKKSEKNFVTRPPISEKPIWFVQQNKKDTNANLLLNLQEVYLDLFSYKMSLKQPVQSLVQCFVTDYLKHKTVNRAHTHFTKCNFFS